MEDNPFNQKERASGHWRYKMTVTVETPEGEISGSAVREMGNTTPRIQMPDVGNPAKVRGEAVVVDMGERGVLFALISDESDNRFYDAFPLPGRADGQGGSTAQGIRHHASLPVGTKGTLNPAEWPGYPKLVTFTNMDDPKSVTLAQIWERPESGKLTLKEDRMEELFGEGVKLKSIDLEITNEPVTLGVVDRHLSWLDKYKKKRLRLNGRTGAIFTNELSDNLGTGAFSNLERNKKHSTK